jgi:flagellin
VQSIVQRVRDLAVQSGNDSNNTTSRAAIQTEVTALSDELTRISASTNFNGIKLLDTAAAATPLTFQVGAGGVAAADQIQVKMTDVSAVADAVADLTFTSAADAATAITALDTQITNISSARAGLGAAQNRFESTINTLNVSSENLAAAQSRIRDTDMATEMVAYTRASVLSQAGTAMLAQANQSNQGVLKLLG